MVPDRLRTLTQHTRLASFRNDRCSCKDGLGLRDISMSSTQSASPNNLDEETPVLRSLRAQVESQTQTISALATQISSLDCAVGRLRAVVQQRLVGPASPPKSPRAEVGPLTAVREMERVVQHYLISNRA